MTVDQEARCAAHPDGLGCLSLRLDHGGIFPRIQALREALRIQAQLLRKLLQVFLVEGSLVLPTLAFEKQIVVSPKSLFTLFAGAFAGFRRPLGFRTQEGEVDIPQADDPLLDIFFIDLTPRASGPAAAVGSLKVAELDDGYRGVGAALEVAGLGDELAHQCLPLSSLIRGYRFLGIRR